MKVLLSIKKDLFGEDKDYKMFVVDTDELGEQDKKIVPLDINVLKECSNVKVNLDNFKSNDQDPSEYIEGIGFDIDKIKRSGNDSFTITNVYYDEFNEPQLYRTVYSNGYVSMHDISEFEYCKRSCINAKALAELPEYVKKEPLTHAYEYWKEKDEIGKNQPMKFFSGQFDTYESMPVKLLYHYLIGVKGFKVGFETKTVREDKQDILCEYLLFNGTANIKLTESIPMKKNSFSYSFGYDFGYDRDPYPSERTLKYYGGSMSIICDREKFPVFDRLGGSRTGYGENLIEVDYDVRNRMMSFYNKIEEAGCIVNDFCLDENHRFSLWTLSHLMPEEFSLLGTRLQTEKENSHYGHVGTMSHGHWSSFNTSSWMSVMSLYFAASGYSPELKEKMVPVFENYFDLFYKELGEMIEELGPRDALEAMQWSKETIKKLMDDITYQKQDGSTFKLNKDEVDEADLLFYFRRNSYDLPDYARIYSKKVIDALGGENLLKDLIKNRGEEMAKKVIVELAEGLEKEIAFENRGKRINNTDEFVEEENLSFENVGRRK